MTNDKFFVLTMAIFASALAASFSRDLLIFLADYFAGAAMCAAINYIAEDSDST